MLNAVSTARGKPGDALRGANEDHTGHDEPDDDDFEEPPCATGGIVLPRRHPGDPTAQEVEQHNMTHCPFRSWCPVCVEAQAKEDPHYRDTKADVVNEAPMVSMDYKELSEYDDDKRKVTVIVCRDKWSKLLAAFVVKAKGSTECAKRIVEYLDVFGYNEIVLKSDNESSIKVLRDEVISKRTRPTRPAGSVPMHPQTHGTAEKAVQDITDQIRKLKLGLERRLNVNVPADAPLMHWLVEHAATLINRHQLGHDGKTAHRRVHQREAPASQFEFGEQVLARFAPKRGKTKRKVPLAPRSTPATWVGVHEATTENIVVLQSGRAARVRTVFRRPDDERWNSDIVKTVRATPMCPNTSSPEDPMPVLRSEPNEESSPNRILPDTPTSEIPYRRRNFKLTKRLIDEYGITPGCVGCEAMQQGTRRSHSAYCRKRIAERLEETEEGRKRLSDAENRLKEHRERLGKEVKTNSADVPSSSADEESDEEHGSDNDDMGLQAPERAPEAKIAAWINRLTDTKCTADEIKEILMKLDGEPSLQVRCNSGTSKESANDVSEIYSPPRVVTRAARHGLRPGFSLDLTGNDETGNKWDFSDAKMRNKAADMINDEQPEMLILSPMCSSFSQMQNLNYSKMDPDEVRAKLREGMLHLKFAAKLCRLQVQHNKMFMFEHPSTA